MPRDLTTWQAHVAMAVCNGIDFPERHVLLIRQINQALSLGLVIIQWLIGR
jgi:hypothetical protein